MAALPFEDELNGLVCTICLDLFNEPVTLPCGHSFCCVCIVKYWESSDGPRACVCANCREIFLQKPTLKRSVILDCFVKQVKLKKREVGFLVRGQDDPKNEEHVTAHRRGGESRCEVCNRESVKRCVPCEIMCCERHVKPHKEKGHRLVEPGEKMEELKCTEHGKLIHFYCKEDESLICLSCMIEQHQNHKVLSVERAHSKLKGVLAEKYPPLVESMKDVESQMQELKQEIEETQHSDKESEKTLEWKRRGLHQVVDESVNIMKRWLNERRRVKLAHLEQKKQKLQQHTNSLCGTESAVKTALQELESVVFLRDCKKVLHSLEAQSHVTFTESAPPALLEFPAVERPADSFFQVNDNLLKEIRKEFVKHLKISDVGCSSLKSLYGCIPSLDANSAHPRIVISEDLRTATRTDNAEPYPEHPDRFVSWHQVSAESFSSGCHYWEVDVSLRHYYWVGVTLNSMARKGKCGKLGRNPESWCVEKFNKRYFVWHDDEGTTLSVPGNPERIGFLLDCEGGELTCFGDSRVLHVFRGNFTDPVKPVMGFGFGRGSMCFC